MSALWGLARPNVLMFGDFLWIENRTQQQARQEQAWLDRLETGAVPLAVVELGAGPSIPTVQMTSHTMIQEQGARLIRINPRDPTVPTPRDASLPLGALEALQGIDAV